MSHEIELKLALPRRALPALRRHPLVAAAEKCGNALTLDNTYFDTPKLQLKARKVRNIEALRPDVIATGNIGCITQIATGTQVPILHTVELLDWAYGGTKPAVLS